MNGLDVVVLAGGKGTRMNSDVLKPLHEVGGKPAIQRILENVKHLSERPIIVIGPHSAPLVKVLGGQYRFVMQEKPLGTGNAVRAVKNTLARPGAAKHVMVVPGDHPLTNWRTLEALVASHVAAGAAVTLGTITVPDFQGDNEIFWNYGRIKRDKDGKIASIVELKDATDAEREIREVNITNYCFKAGWLWENIDLLANNNKAGEFYLTDMVGIAVSQGLPVAPFPILDIREGMGFNTPEQLAIIRKQL